MPIDIEEILNGLKDEREKTASAQDEFKTSLLDESEKTQEKTASTETKAEEPKAEEPKAEEPKAEEPAQEKVATETKGVLSDEELLQKLASDEQTQMQVAQADLIGRALARGYYDELQQLVMPQSNYPAPQPQTGGSIPAKETMPQHGPSATPQQANPGNPGGSEKNASVDILTKLYHNNFNG